MGMEPKACARSSESLRARGGPGSTSAVACAKQPASAGARNSERGAELFSAVFFRSLILSEKLKRSVARNNTCFFSVAKKKKRARFSLSAIFEKLHSLKARGWFPVIFGKLQLLKTVASLAAIERAVRRLEHAERSVEARPRRRQRDALSSCASRRLERASAAFRAACATAHELNSCGLRKCRALLENPRNSLSPVSARGLAALERILRLAAYRARPSGV